MSVFEDVISQLPAPAASYHAFPTIIGSPSGTVSHINSLTFIERNITQSLKMKWNSQEMGGARKKIKLSEIIQTQKDKWNLFTYTWILAVKSLISNLQSMWLQKVGREWGTVGKISLGRGNKIVMDGWGRGTRMGEPNREGEGIKG